MSSSSSTAIESKNYTFTNWGRCWGSSNPKSHLYPASTTDVQNIISETIKAKSSSSSSSSFASFPSQNVRAVGCGYSPNDICFTSGTMIHPDKMKKIEIIGDNTTNEKCRYIKCGAGVLLSEACTELDKHQLVLPTAVSVVDITVVGAAAVGAHGTGRKFASFSEYVAEVEGVNGLGEIVRASELTGENIALLPALRCHLGLLMVVTSITMKVFPKKLYTISSKPTTLADVLENLDQKVDGSDFYKLIWIPNTKHVFETFSGEIPPPSPSYSTTIKVNELPPVVCSSKNNGSLRRHLSELAFYWAHDNLSRLSKVHNAFIRLYFNSAVDNSIETALKIKNNKTTVGDESDAGKKSTVEVTAGSVMHFNGLDVSFQHATVEWAIPRKYAAEAIKRWAEIVEEEKLVTHLLLEARFSKQDDADRVWVSPNSGRDSCFLGIVIFRPFELDSATMKQVFLRFQNLMLVYEGRSHWSKPYRLGHEELRRSYPKWDAFENIRKKMDPFKIFENDWSKRHEVPMLKSLL